MKANFFVIIATYNAMKWAERCFGSLRRSSVPVKTIAVDNGSTDGTQDFIKKNFPEVEFIQSEENLGFGKANNIGIEKAYKQGAEFFYLMNQDAWIFEDSFEKLLEVYENHPHKEEIGILSPMHLDGSELRLDPHFQRYIARSVDINNFIGESYLQTLQPFYEMNFVNAAHWLLPKGTIEKVGGFNPFYFHYGEDYEYVNRLAFKEKKLFFAPGSKVVHDAKKNEEKMAGKDPIREKWLSFRLQKQAVYFNPLHYFEADTVKRELWTDFIKLMLKGRFRDGKEQWDMMKYFLPNLQTIGKHRETAIIAPHAFLNL
ncbi:glycosyltransferase family 2 protein [Cruoricaptor ignavus]|uniref:Glycosyltransferase family 2 protein n=1 Tax=Cruoricaptor ignavus TaxID=1118202 RepID=A0A7M1T389_9FLAO|nr:glycosyltransferase family 2 protein [Cruoricaptor ignavus]QOR73373.1 glycosyltransferase family 2 protein [Cruoricaptor ignavus]